MQVALNKLVSRSFYAHPLVCLIRKFIVFVLGSLQSTIALPLQNWTWLLLDFRIREAGVWSQSLVTCHTPASGLFLLLFVASILVSLISILPEGAKNIRLLAMVEVNAIFSILPISSETQSLTHGLLATPILPRVKLAELSARTRPNQMREQAKTETVFVMLPLAIYFLKSKITGLSADRFLQLESSQSFQVPWMEQPVQGRARTSRRSNMGTVL